VAPGLPRLAATLDSADYQSTLEPIREVRLAFEIGGRIVSMSIFEGQAVRLKRARTA
jgi:hypothetical protein